MSQSDERLVIEGGRVKLLTQARQAAGKDQGGVIIDYLRFTLNKDDLVKDLDCRHETDDRLVAQMMAIEFAKLLGFSLGVDRPGRDYYEFTTTIQNSLGHEVASVSTGGDSQRGSVLFTMKGEACTHARPGWENRIYGFFKHYCPKVTRVDLARDFYAGEVTIGQAVAAYRDHAFSYRKRLPSHECHGCWLASPDNQADEDGVIERTGGHSRTFQIGKRESGKLCRIYEKGHQYRLMSDPWVRVECELRSVNRVIPWETIIQPGAFFAGAYEWCAWLVDNVKPMTVPTKVKVGQASVERCINWVNRVVAPTLVQITSALPDFKWLEAIVLDQVDRKVPRGLRGLDHFTMKKGLELAFKNIYSSPDAAPVGDSLVMA